MKQITGFFIGLVLACTFFKLCNRSPSGNFHLPGKTDTVYVPKVFKLDKPLTSNIIPNMVFMYKLDTVVELSKIEVSPNLDLKLYSNNKDTLTISKYYIGNYPTNPKLLQIDLTSKRLKLSLLSTNGEIRTEQYDLDLNKYNYRYQERLTAKRKSKFNIHPTISYSYRPINNLHDLDLSLNLETSRINIVTGFNSFYYPNVFNSPKMDFKIGIQYKF